MRFIRISIFISLIALQSRGENFEPSEELKNEILVSLLSKGNHFNFISQSLNQIKHDFVEQLKNAGYNNTDELQLLLEPKKTVGSEYSYLSDPKEEDFDWTTLINGEGPKAIYNFLIKPAFLFIIGNQLPDLGIDQDELILRFLGSITPILAVSEGCSNQSWTMLYNMFVTQGGLPDSSGSSLYGLPWAFKMFDSSGKLPNGIYADTLEFCEFLDQYAPLLGFPPISCEQISEGFNLPPELASLVNLRGLINMPYGNTRAFGSYQACISTRSNILNANFTSEAYNGSYNILNLEDDFRAAWMPLTIQSTIDLAALVPNKDRPSTRLASGFSVIDGLWNNLGNMENFTIPATVEGVLSFVSLLYLSVADFKFGACVPEMCTTADIMTNYGILYSSINATTRPGYEKPLTEEFKRHEMDDFARSMVVIFGIIASFMLIGTLIEIWEQCNPFPVLSITSKGQPDNVAVSALKGFSILKNGRQILNTETGKNHLNCLSGMRFISMCWIIYGHLYLITSMLDTAGGALQNRKIVNYIQWGNEGWIYELLINGFPSVDTFFFMSGVLLAYLSFGEMDKGKFNLPMYYIHRFIRLGIPLALTIAFIAAFPPFMSYGPFYYYEFLFAQSDLCRKTGWRNLLFINNFWPQGEQCVAQTWYLANDMQYYCLAPLLLIPLYKRPKYGLIFAGAIYTVLTFIMGFLVITYKLPPTHTFVTHEVDFDMTTYFYDAPWARFQPYLIGILFGFLLYKTKNKDIKIPHALNLALWQLSLITMFAVVFGVSGLRKNENFVTHTWTPFESLIYNCFHKTAWSLALGWIVFSCHKGYGGIVNDFLSWRAFLPLSKLTFAAYLNHITLQGIVFFGLSTPMYFTDFLLSQYFIGVLCFTFGAAFVQTITVESPFVNLEKILLGGGAKRPRPVPKKPEQQMNGHANKEQIVEKKEEREAYKAKESDRVMAKEEEAEAAKRA